MENMRAIQLGDYFMFIGFEGLEADWALLQFAIFEVVEMSGTFKTPLFSFFVS